MKHSIDFQMLSKDAAKKKKKKKKKQNKQNKCNESFQFKNRVD